MALFLRLVSHCKLSIVLTVTVIKVGTLICTGLLLLPVLLIIVLSSRTLDIKPLAFPKEKDRTTPKTLYIVSAMHASYNKKTMHVKHTGNKQHLALVYIPMSCTLHVHSTAQHSKQRRDVATKHTHNQYASSTFMTSKIVQL